MKRKRFLSKKTPHELAQAGAFKLLPFIAITTLNQLTQQLAASPDPNQGLKDAFNEARYELGPYVGLGPEWNGSFEPRDAWTTLCKLLRNPDERLNASCLLFELAYLRTSRAVLSA